MMQNDKFKKFLETQAGRTSLAIYEDRIYWEEKGGKAALPKPSPRLDKENLAEKFENGEKPSERFRKFLRVGDIPFKESGVETLSSEPSDFLEPFYLGRELQNTAVMDRSVAAMFKRRLGEMEGENSKMRRTVRTLKITLFGAVATSALLILWMVLSLII